MISLWPPVRLADFLDFEYFTIDFQILSLRRGGTSIFHIYPINDSLQRNMTILSSQDIEQDIVAIDVGADAHVLNFASASNALLNTRLLSKTYIL